MPKIRFELDGKQVEASAGETIWQVAHRQGGELPHLCYWPEPDYRPDGNCRACMVEIEGERVLAASCKRTPSVGMKVKTESPRAAAAQKRVMELLVADQPARATSHDPDSKFWHWAETTGVTESRFPAAERWRTDDSHPAMRVNLDACIQCGLCVRACREVQVNDVIGMAYRNHGSKILVDFHDPMGESTRVALGESGPAWPTRPIPLRISARLPGKRRSISRPRASSRFATRRASRRSPVSARPRAPTRRPICSRSWCAPASVPTMSITARGCATPPRWRP